MKNQSPAKSKRILCLGGSLNQTTILHKIAQNLPEADFSFSPFFAEGFLSILFKAGLLEHTIMGGAHRRATMQYIKENNLPLDEGGRQGPYDMVITCTDLIIQPSLRNSRILLVQEGITEAEGFSYWLVKWLGLPRVMANTAATGLSHAYEYFCVASPGYRAQFINKGVRPQKIHVTGIPNFDNASNYKNNQFPHRNFVLAATSSIRETFGQDDRQAFLLKVKRIAASRRVIFKLHPNEDQKRATREIRRLFPEALIYVDGSLHEMIANCDVLVAQVTSAIFTAAALGKEVHSYIPIEKIRELLPVQNEGRSAARIADVCRSMLRSPIPVENSRPRGIPELAFMKKLSRMSFFPFMNNQ